jgi:hypothetical protein
MGVIFGFLVRFMVACMDVENQAVRDKGYMGLQKSEYGYRTMLARSYKVWQIISYSLFAIHIFSCQNPSV